MAKDAEMSLLGTLIAAFNGCIDNLLPSKLMPKNRILCTSGKTYPYGDQAPP